MYSSYVNSRDFCIKLFVVFVMVFVDDFFSGGVIFDGVSVCGDVC